MSVKKLHCATLIHQLKRWMACLNIGNRAWLARALSYWGHLEIDRFGARAEERNITACVIAASAHTDDHV